MTALDDACQQKRGYVLSTDPAGSELGEGLLDELANLGGRDLVRRRDWIGDADAGRQPEFVPCGVQKPRERDRAIETARRGKTAAAAVEGRKLVAAIDHHRHAERLESFEGIGDRYLTRLEQIRRRASIPVIASCGRQVFSSSSSALLSLLFFGTDGLVLALSSIVTEDQALAYYQKLADAGTRGLHGGIGNLATTRKSRLVEHALSTRLVTANDLALLDGAGSPRGAAASS